MDENTDNQQAQNQSDAFVADYTKKDAVNIADTQAASSIAPEADSQSQTVAQQVTDAPQPNEIDLTEAPAPNQATPQETPATEDTPTQTVEPALVEDSINTTAEQLSDTSAESPAPSDSATPSPNEELVEVGGVDITSIETGIDAIDDDASAIDDSFGDLSEN